MRNSEPGLSPIVKDVTRIVAAFIIIFGIYIVLHGHLTPGGGFPGGVILAAGLVLVVLAFGKNFSRRFVTERMASFWDSAGAMGFLAIALCGYLVGEFFLMRFLPFIRDDQPFKLLSAPEVLLANLAIAAKVGAAMFGVFVAMALWRPNRTGGDQ